MRRRFSKDSAYGTLSEINVTPLLDLAFVLLIIFMITASLLDNSADLVIPTSAVNRPATDPNRMEYLSVDRNHVLRLGQADVQYAELAGILRERAERDPDYAIVIRAHRDLPVQDLIDLMDAMKKAGITRVGVVTRQQGG